MGLILALEVGEHIDLTLPTGETMTIKLVDTHSYQARGIGEARLDFVGPRSVVITRRSLTDPDGEAASVVKQAEWLAAKRAEKLRSTSPGATGNAVSAVGYKTCPTESTPAWAAG